MSKGFIIGGFISIVLLSGVGFISHASAGCATESCPLDISSHTKMMEEGELESGSLTELQIVCGIIKQDQLWAGRERVKFGESRQPGHDELETRNRNIRLVLHHILSPSWSLSAGVPFLQRSHSHIEHSDHGHEGEDGTRKNAFEQKGWARTKKNKEENTAGRHSLIHKATRTTWVHEAKKARIKTHPVHAKRKQTT